jgi:hypothetical protein
VIPILAAVIASPTGFLPSATDLLETRLCYLWSELSVIETPRVLFDGEPVLLFGEAPLPPWGSFSEARIASPLEAGVWGSCGWTVDFVSAGEPDSSFRSCVGLLENTRGRNRYSGTLERPLPAGLRFAATLSREDTLSKQRIQLSRGSFDIGGHFWQEATDGGAGWLGFRTGGSRIRGGVGMRSTGRHLWEGIASQGLSLGRLGVEAAAAVAGIDTVTSMEAHLAGRLAAGPLVLTCRADLSGRPDSTAAGWCAGILSTVLGVDAGAGIISRPGSDPGGILTLARGLLGFELTVSGDGVTTGAHASRPSWIQASVLHSPDSLRVSGAILPGMRWGGEGLVRAGARGTAVEGDDGWEGRLELLGAVSIGSFAFLAAAEDLLDDYERHYTFGVVWAFDDKPAQQGGGDERDR